MTADAAHIEDYPGDDELLAASVRHVRGHFDSGDYINALEACEVLLAQRPACPEALLLLGLISYELEEPQRALLLLRQAHEAAPRVREYANALACVNAQLGYDIEALFHAKLATILTPHPLGEALLPEGYSRFFDSLRHARPHLFRNRAQRLLDKGDAAGAFAAGEKQLELTPADGATWRLLAEAAGALGKVDRVLDACDSLRGDGLTARDYDVLASALATIGRFDEAEQAHANAIEAEPANPLFPQHRLCTLAARHGNTGGRLAGANDAWVERYAPRAGGYAQSAPSADEPARPLRIAYVGGELHAGPLADLLTPILAAHDAARVHAYCYATGVRYDLCSEAMAAHCVRWTDINGVDPVTAAQILRGDGIDIAIDLSGHGPGSQLQMFAQRPAPVCASWLGTALPAGGGFDFLLASAALMPSDCDAGGAAHAIYRLPAAHLAHRPTDAPSTISALPAHTAGHPTIGVMAPLAHLGEACVRDWAEILDHVGDARIVVANVARLDDPAVHRIDELTSRAGIRERVDVADLAEIDPNGYAFFDHFDILLDPQPNSRFLETVRALWMGVPVFALAGVGPLGRQAAAALTAAGCDDWVFETNRARAVAIAELATDLGRLAQMRARLRKDVAATPLCDVSGFTRALEQAYHTMSRRPGAGEPSAQIS